MGAFDILDAALGSTEGGGGGKVTFVCQDGPNSCQNCLSHNGKTYDAASAPKPPLHPNCNCSLSPG